MKQDWIARAFGALRRHVHNVWAELGVLTTVALVMAAVTIALFGWVAALVFSGRVDDLDRSLMLAVLPYRSEAASALMNFFAFVGGGRLALPIALLVAWVLYRQARRRSAILYAWICLSGYGLNHLAKWLFQRARPDIIPRLSDSTWYSFPSGHAMLAPLVFGLGALLLARRVRSPAARLAVQALGVLFVLGISLSRVYLGVHYPSDVVGALLAGLGWAALWVWLAMRRAPGVPPIDPGELSVGVTEIPHRPGGPARLPGQRRGRKNRVG